MFLVQLAKDDQGLPRLAFDAFLDCLARVGQVLLDLFVRWGTQGWVVGTPERDRHRSDRQRKPDHEYWKLHQKFYSPRDVKRQAMLVFAAVFSKFPMALLLAENPAAPLSGEGNATVPPVEKSLATFRFSLGKQDKEYSRSVQSLILLNELKGGVELHPERQSKIGLKVSTHFAPGLATPSRLVDAVLEFLKLRGFKLDDVFLLDLEANNLRRAGFLPPRSIGTNRYRGHRVLALDSRRHFDAKWFHDSPIPPTADFRARISLRNPRGRTSRLREERRSYLPAPLFIDDAYWINLPVALDSRSLVIDAAVANASLRAVDNNARFLGRQTTAPAAATEILAVPEYCEKHLFSILDLYRFQYAGGDRFDASFIASEPTLLLSENPFSLDAFALVPLNEVRRAKGFKPRPRKDSPIFRFAEELGLAELEKAKLIDVP